MPPPSPWVLLQRCVNFFPAGSAESEREAAAAIAESRGWASLTMEEATAAMTPDEVDFADPPEVTTLCMLRHLPSALMGSISTGYVSSSHKGLLVLYTGSYQPGCGSYTLPAGCYLVYDAAAATAARSSVLAAIPPLDRPIPGSNLPVRPAVKWLGNTAAILRLRPGSGGGGGGRGGAYVLADLATTSVHRGLPDADLYLWASTAAGQWRRTAARLPLPAELCGPTTFFHVDMAFALGDSCVCWADLLTGVLICDLFAPQGPEFSFVPLPQEGCMHIPEKVRLTLRTQEFRSMGCCVCGGGESTIRFVALLGYPGVLPNEEVVLKSWTLSSSSTDFKESKEGPGVSVRDLWESESFREMELPRRLPMNPVVSMDEDEVIYLSLSDLESVEEHDYFGRVTGRNLVLNGHYVLRLDLLQNKVLCSKKSATNSFSLLHHNVVASDFSAYLHDRKDSQRGKEASKVGELWWNGWSWIEPSVVGADVKGTEVSNRV